MLGAREMDPTKKRKRILKDKEKEKTQRP